MKALSWSEVERDRRLLPAWEELLSQRSPPSALHSSPDWVAHLAATGTPGVVVLVQERGPKVVGIMPTLRHRFVLGCEVGSRVVPLARLRAACVLGNVPLLSEDALAPEFIANAFELLPDCDAILFDALPLSSGLFRLFDRSSSASGFLPYCLDAQQRAHSLRLEGSFDSYVGRMAGKSRYNLRRAVRMLNERGALELMCCRTTEQLTRFLPEAAEAQKNSWQNRSMRELGGDIRRYTVQLRDLAQRGLLRSYLLRSGQTPCAFAVGYQGRGVYHYWEIGYNRRFAEYSPGTVLLHLLLEDLFSVDPPNVFDFGRGDEDYKQRFGTRARAVASGLLLRPTRPNAWRVRGHQLVLGSAARLREAWRYGFRAVTNGAPAG